MPGVYAMAGAAGVLGGVTQMTVSLTVIMFELTGGLTYILPIMTSVMCAKWVADASGRESIYDAAIALKGYPYLSFKQSISPGHFTAADIMETDGDILDMDTIYRISDIQNLCDQMDTSHPSFDGGFPILKDKKQLVGYISQTDLRHALSYSRLILDLILAENDVQVYSIVFHDLISTEEQLAESPKPFSPIYCTDDSNGPICDLSQWVDKVNFV